MTAELITAAGRNANGEDAYVIFYINTNVDDALTCDIVADTIANTNSVGYSTQSWISEEVDTVMYESVEYEELDYFNGKSILDVR